MRCQKESDYIPAVFNLSKKHIHIYTDGLFYTDTFAVLIPKPTHLTKFMQILTLNASGLSSQRIYLIGVFVLSNFRAEKIPNSNCKHFSCPASTTTYYLARWAFPFPIGHGTRMRTFSMKYTRTEITCDNFPCFVTVPAIPVMSV